MKESTKRFFLPRKVTYSDLKSFNMGHTFDVIAGESGDQEWKNSILVRFDGEEESRILDKRWLYNSETNQDLY